ncbi:HSP20 domain-containing protein [Cephalotus follicularis]|uniref:HSP20 domain-containing protein n=1 Tax=Cephalotus follicularis TaxID=3775 RepID=A0A1Q3D3N1_CEPFO|nr:HSP20 domain-containing protein [Cephalotus follicularis]
MIEQKAHEILEGCLATTMVSARLALRNMQQRVSTSLLGYNMGEKRIGGDVQRLRWSDEFMKRFMATTATEDETEGKDKKEGKNVSVTEGGKKSSLFHRRKGKRGLWRRHNHDLVPALQEFLPSRLGNALLQATENINKLFHNLPLSPSRLMGRVKEQDECYKLRYHVPGLGKDDVKIIVHDGVLTIKGELKEEEEEDSDEEYWPSRGFFYYINTSVVLPDDAKLDDIKAELKNGLLDITIPRSEKPNKDVKEIKIN